MKKMHAAQLACSALLASCGLALGDITYTFQDRAITATTTDNLNTQTIQAPGFGPFVEQLDLETQMLLIGGGVAPNTARVGIDCQLNPNAIRVIGSLAGSGGISVTSGPPTQQFGEAAARVVTIFLVSSPTALRMTATPRPSTRPGDRFKIKLKNETTGVTLFLLEENMPPQAVDFRGTLTPGQYEVEYQVELTVDGPETLRNFLFNFQLGECYVNCDDSSVLPQLSVNDFICFMNRFGAGDSYANCDQSTQAPTLNVNDFTCFLQRFAAGCD